MSADLVVADWPAPPNVRAVVTTRRLPGESEPPFDRCNLGGRCGDAPAAVIANRERIEAMLELPESPRWLKQVHGVAVHDADALIADAEPEADAAISRVTGRVLAVLTADCLPVFLCRDDGTAIGVAHAGWRGLASGVIEAAVSALGDAASLIAWLGPAIGATSYEVGDEVRAAFVDADAGAADAFEATRPGHWRCDLYALARRRLAACGVARVSGGGFDTFADARFYSYRCDRETGRFASLIWLEPAAVKVDDAIPDDATDATPAVEPVFARVLGASFARLAPRVRELHVRKGMHRWRGRATVRRGESMLARLCARVAGMPRATPDAPIDVEITADASGETWTRHFGSTTLRTRLWVERALLRERFGPVTFGFALDERDGVLRWTVREAHFFGVSLPVRWFRGVDAREWQTGGRYCFEAKARFPIAGDVVHYDGWLAAVDG
jgi:YfiH family protein